LTEKKFRVVDLKLLGKMVECTDAEEEDEFAEKNASGISHCSVDDR
jgi:hypothetical protein